MLQSFNYVAAPDSRILILGTMPGEASLKAQQYYAHPRNAFWKIMADVFNNGNEFTSYQSKLQCLLNNEIALWDNLQYCERQGSLDSDIKQESPNDIEQLLRTIPSIKTILFNGQKSYAFFKKYHSELLAQINWQIMPSTSPANAGCHYNQKLNLWKQALMDYK